MMRGKSIFLWVAIFLMGIITGFGVGNLYGCNSYSAQLERKLTDVQSRFQTVNDNYLTLVREYNRLFPLKRSTVGEVSNVPVAPATDGPVSLTVYNPTGASEVSQTFAPRLSDLNGKTICEVTIGIWEANRTFPLIRGLLQKQFPTVKMVAFDQLPRLSETKEVAGLEDAVKKAGCQAVILGNAG